MKKVMLLLAVVSALALVGCSGSGLGGAIYADQKIHLNDDIEPAAKGSKMGEATCVSYLGLVGIGDCSIEAAMAAGGIKKMTASDYHNWNILGIVSKHTYIVYGD
jgi:hypothetical protein